MKKTSAQSGFTLIELMVVIAIIAILTVIGISGFSSSLRKGRDARRKSDIQAISQALTLFRMDHAYYPHPDKEYFLAEGASTTTGCGNGSKPCKAFGDYMKIQSLFDPSSNNYNGKFSGAVAGSYPYSYFCLGAGTTGRCKSYLICAQLETDSGNFKPIAGNPFFPFTAVSKGGGGVINTSQIGELGNIVARPEGVKPAWYCAESN